MGTEVNNPKQNQTYNSDNDWPDVDTAPGYAGESNKINVEGRTYSLKPTETAQ